MTNAEGEQKSVYDEFKEEASKIHERMRSQSKHIIEAVEEEEKLRKDLEAEKEAIITAHNDLAKDCQDKVKASQEATNKKLQEWQTKATEKATEKERTRKNAIASYETTCGEMKELFLKYPEVAELFPGAWCSLSNGVASPPIVNSHVLDQEEVNTSE